MTTPDGAMYTDPVDATLPSAGTSEMEHDITPNHLTSLYIPNLAVPLAHGYMRFHALARTLREQCPWDIEQTHTSLLPYLIEETYEVVDAINAKHGACATCASMRENILATICEFSAVFMWTRANRSPVQGPAPRHVRRSAKV